MAPVVGKVEVRAEAYDAWERTARYPARLGCAWKCREEKGRGFSELGARGRRYRVERGRAGVGKTPGPAGEVRGQMACGRWEAVQGLMRKGTEADGNAVRSQRAEMEMWPTGKEGGGVCGGAAACRLAARTSPPPPLGQYLSTGNT